MSDVLEGVGRRERKKLETRRALQQAALRLAADKGPDQVSIEEIADAADVSVRTFFNYFSSKEEAIIGWDPEGRAAMAQRLVDRPAEEAPFTALRNLVAEMFENADEWVDDRATRHRLVREHPSLLPRHLAAHHELEHSLLEALAERMGVDPETDLYPALLVTTTVNAMRMALTWWEHTDRSTSLPDLLDEAFDALERGLTPPNRKKAK